MADALPGLREIVDEIELARLTNIAWIEQAEQFNARSHNLPGARKRTPVFAGTVHWLRKLVALSDAAGGDDKVEAWLDRALEKTATPDQPAEASA